MISKKELLLEMNISYGQLYRWKREGLIPGDWFQKVSVSTGQETFFDEALIIPRIHKILELKDRYSLEELRAMLNPKEEEIIYSRDELKRFIHPDLLNKCFDKIPANNTLYGLTILYVFTDLLNMYSRASIYEVVNHILEQDNFLIQGGILCVNFKRQLTVSMFHKPAYFYGEDPEYDVDLEEKQAELIKKLKGER